MEEARNQRNKPAWQSPPAIHQAIADSNSISELVLQNLLDASDKEATIRDLLASIQKGSSAIAGGASSSSAPGASQENKNNDPLIDEEMDMTTSSDHQDQAP